MERTANTLIRLGGCPEGSESSLDARASLLVLSWCGLFGKSTLTSFSLDIGILRNGTGQSYIGFLNLHNLDGINLILIFLLLPLKILKFRVFNAIYSVCPISFQSIPFRKIPIAF